MRPSNKKLFIFIALTNIFAIMPTVCLSQQNGVIQNSRDVEGEIGAPNYFTDTPLDILDSITLLQQVKGWEWVYMENPKRQHLSYPEDLTFYSYPSHKQYRFFDYHYVNTNGIPFYDNTGKLVRWGYLLRAFNQNPIPDKVGYYERVLSTEKYHNYSLYKWLDLYVKRCYNKYIIEEAKKHKLEDPLSYCEYWPNRQIDSSKWHNGFYKDSITCFMKFSQQTLDRYYEQRWLDLNGSKHNLMNLDKLHILLKTINDSQDYFEITCEDIVKKEKVLFSTIKKVPYVLVYASLVNDPCPHPTIQEAMEREAGRLTNGYNKLAEKNEYSYEIELVYRCILIKSMLDDIRNDKYGIRTNEPERVKLDFLRGLKPFTGGGLFYEYRESKAKLMTRQLIQDHKNDFTELSEIRRLDDLSFSIEGIKNKTTGHLYSVEIRYYQDAPYTYHYQIWVDGDKWMDSNNYKKTGEFYYNYLFK